MANKSPHPRILASGKSREKTVCLSCVRKDITPSTGVSYRPWNRGSTEGERGEVTGRRLGPLEGEREREREREREGPKAVEGRTPGGSWKKAGGKPGRREGEAEEKNGEGGGCLVGDCGGDAGVPARQKKRAVSVRRPVGNKVLALFYFPT